MKTTQGVHNSPTRNHKLMNSIWRQRTRPRRGLDLQTSQNPVGSSMKHQMKPDPQRPNPTTHRNRRIWSQDIPKGQDTMGRGCCGSTRVAYSPTRLVVLMLWLIVCSRVQIYVNLCAKSSANPINKTNVPPFIRKLCSVKPWSVAGS